MSKSFSEQVDEVIADTFDKENSCLFVRATTPSIFMKYANIRNLPIVMTYTKLKISMDSSGKYSDHYHNLGAETIKKIPIELETPEYIFKQKNGRIGGILKITDKKGRSVFVSIEIEVEKPVNDDYSGGYRGKQHLLVTVFGAKKAYLDKLLSESEVLYTKKSSSTQSNPQSNDLDIVNVNEFNTIIRNTTKKVNTQSKKKSKKQFDLTPDRHYTVTESKEMLDSVLKGELESRFDAKIKGKGALIDKIKELLNETEEENRVRMSKLVADYIIKKTVVSETDAQVAIDGDLQRLDFFRNSVMKKYNLKAIEKEIEYKYGKNKARGIILAWSNSDKKGIDRISVDLDAELMGLGIEVGNGNEADIFFALYDAYQGARTGIAKSINKELSTVLSEDELKELKESIADKVLEEYDKKGLRTVVNELKRKVKSANNSKRAAMSLQSLVDEFKSYGKRSYSASVLATDEWKMVIGAFSKVVQRNSISVPQILNAVKLAKRVYTIERVGEWYDKDLREDLDYLDSNVEIGKELSDDDVWTLNKVAKRLEHLYKTFDRVKVDEKWLETVDISNDIIKRSSALPKVKGMSVEQSGLFLVPRAMFRTFTGYHEDSPLMKAYNDINAGEGQKAVIFDELISPITKYLKKTKGYEKRLNNVAIAIKAIDRATRKTDTFNIPVGTAISLYLTSKREQAVAGLFQAGIRYSTKNLLGKETTYRLSITQENLVEIEKALTEQDKAFNCVIAYDDRIIIFYNTSKDAQIDVSLKNFPYRISCIEEQSEYLGNIGDMTEIPEIGNKKCKSLDLVFKRFAFGGQIQFCNDTIISNTYCKFHIHV